MKNLNIDSILSYTIEAFIKGLEHSEIKDTLSSYVQDFKEKVAEEERIKNMEASGWNGLHFYKNSTYHIETLEDLEMAFVDEILYNRECWSDEEINIITETGIDLSPILKNK